MWICSWIAFLICLDFDPPVKPTAEAGLQEWSGTLPILLEEICSSCILRWNIPIPVWQSLLLLLMYEAIFSIAIEMNDKNHPSNLLHADVNDEST